MTSPTTSLSAGGGRAEMRLTVDDLPVDGFDAVLDPVQVRVVVLDDGARRVALAAFELTSLPSWGVDRYRALVAALTDTAPDDVLITVSHTFSAPHLPPDRASSDAEDRWRRVVDDAVRQACRSASRTLSPATASFARGRCRVNVCRDTPTADGWWLGSDDSGPTDDDLAVLRLDRPDGSPLAVLASYAVQSSVLDGSSTSDGRRLVSADLFGAASRFVEHGTRDRAVVVLLPAAAGDQGPMLTAVRRTVPADPTVTVDAHEAGHVLVELLGERLGLRVARTAAGAVPLDDVTLGVERTTATVPAQVPPVRREDLRPTRDHVFRADGRTDVPIVILRLGPLRLVGVQPELNVITGRELRRRIGDRLLLATVVDGGAKYMADAGSYDRMTYEAMNSRFGRGAAEALVDTICDHLSR